MATCLHEKIERSTKTTYHRQSPMLAELRLHALSELLFIEKKYLATCFCEPFRALGTIPYSFLENSYQLWLPMFAGSAFVKR